jgi:hypothetical protein
MIVYPMELVSHSLPPNHASIPFQMRSTIQMVIVHTLVVLRECILKRPSVLPQIIRIVLRMISTCLITWPLLPLSQSQYKAL